MILKYSFTYEIKEYDRFLFKLIRRLWILLESHTRKETVSKIDDDFYFFYLNNLLNKST
jgi:hypothetical protein